MTNAGLLVAVLVVPLLAALLSLVLKPRWLYGVAAIFEAATLGIALTLITLAVQGPALDCFGHWLYLDGLSGVVLLVVAVVSSLASIYSIGYLRHELREGAVRADELRKYFVVLHLFFFTMIAVTVSGNLGMLWTAISATTLASAPLVDFYGSHQSLEAAWKFIVLTVTGSLVALFGFLLLYQSGVGALGNSYDFSIPVLAGAAGHLSPVLAGTAFLLVLVGFGTKAGLAPMHTWLPDAHSQAPSPVCAMLSGAELNCALLGIFRVYTLAAPAAGAAPLRSGLLAFGLLSMAVGVIFLISQRDFKRLLAYSSVEQIGLICVGVGIGTPLALLGALLLIVAHGLTKCLMFFATGNLLLRFRTTAISGVRGVVQAMPWTATLLVGGALAIAGAPPFGVFIAELSIITGALAGHLWVLAAAVAGLLLVGFIAMVAPFHTMTFSRRADSEAVVMGDLNLLILAPALALLAVILVIGVWVPGPLEDLLHSAASVMGR
jgi:hydrogenase-4 component F